MNQKPLHLMIILFFALLMATSAQAGKVYKWKDPDGSIHYSQTPPQDNHAQQMDVEAPKPTSDAHKQVTTDSAKKQDGKAPENKSEAEQKADLEKKNAEVTAENCKRASQRLRTIEAGGRFYDVNEKGERVYWDDEKRASQLADAQASVDKWCNK